MALLLGHAPEIVAALEPHLGPFPVGTQHTDATMMNLWADYAVAQQTLVACTSLMSKEELASSTDPLLDELRTGLKETAEAFNEGRFLYENGIDIPTNSQSNLEL